MKPGQRNRWLALLGEAASYFKSCPFEFPEINQHWQSLSVVKLIWNALCSKDSIQTWYRNFLLNEVQPLKETVVCLILCVWHAIVITKQKYHSSSIEELIKHSGTDRNCYWVNFEFCKTILWLFSLRKINIGDDSVPRLTDWNQTVFSVFRLRYISITF